ncbi:MAG: DUF2156 domain-containing protein [Treponema sp.]|nr:DUF2156 domain-containing protein [Candidatus Treponema scatequi]
MDVSEFLFLKTNLNTKGLTASDSALANIYLLEPKYRTQISIKNNCLIRKYNGKDNRSGFAFPIPLKDAPDDYLKNAVSDLLKTHSDKTPLRFCLCTMEQKNALDKCFAENFSAYKISWDSNRGDSDYIYLSEKLATLSGKTLHKKKNHVSKFLREYENRFTFKLFPDEDVAEDILKIEDEWFSERSNDVEKAFDEKSLDLERESIKIALDNKDVFGFTGGVIYIDEKPAAFCLASPASDTTLDIHFEKVLADIAVNGGYAAINNLFAKENRSYLYINREEDMNVEGLRHAKLSYKPEIILDKYFGEVELS